MCADADADTCVTVQVSARTSSTISCARSAATRALTCRHRPHYHLIHLAVCLLPDRAPGACQLGWYRGCTEQSRCKFDYHPLTACACLQVLWEGIYTPTPPEAPLAVR
jgi:hypothetical protein